MTECASRAPRPDASINSARTHSSVPGIYAVGDVIDRLQLTPVALAEAMCVVDALFGGASIDRIAIEPPPRRRAPDERSGLPGQHFPRVLARGVGDFDAAQHACDFVDAGAPVECGNA